MADKTKIGVEILFLSSGAVCGFPPCPHISYLRDLTEKSFGMKMVVGTHPIPTTFWEWHKAAGSWNSSEWQGDLPNGRVGEIHIGNGKRT